FHRRQYIHLGSGKELTGDFSSHLSNRVFVFADESLWGTKEAANDLKRLITEDTVMIHPKHLPRYEEQSNLHIIVGSNAGRPLPIERDDRRFAVFEVGESKKNNQNYFGTLRDELDNYGREAAFTEFSDWPITDHLLREPPLTAAKVKMKAASLAPIDR